MQPPRLSNLEGRGSWMGTCANDVRYSPSSVTRRRITLGLDFAPSLGDTPRLHRDCQSLAVETSRRPRVSFVDRARSCFELSDVARSRAGGAACGRSVC